MVVIRHRALLVMFFATLASSLLVAATAAIAAPATVDTSACTYRLTTFTRIAPDQPGVDLKNGTQLNMRDIITATTLPFSQACYFPDVSYGLGYTKQGVKVPRTIGADEWEDNLTLRGDEPVLGLATSPFRPGEGDYSESCE